MTPTPPDQPPRRCCRSLHRGTGGQHRISALVPGHHRRSSPRLSTVWPFADAEALPGTIHLAGWLGQMILTLVTGYTRPTKHVLLLAPPVPAGSGSRVLTASHSDDPYTRLGEAAATLRKLRRRVDTTTVTTNADSPESDSDLLPSPRSAPESRPQPSRPGSHALINPDAHDACTRFDLIITAVYPHTTDWFARIDWTGRLIPAGTLAVITYSQTRADHFCDPVPTLVQTLGHRGLDWLDHIGVLDRPLPAPGHTQPVPPSRVHHDLLLFIPHAEATDEQSRCDS